MLLCYDSTKYPAAAQAGKVDIMEKIVAQIKEWVDAQTEKQRILIAIDGSCTSGKSTLGKALKAEFDCNLFHVDDYFLRPQQRTAERLSEVGGNVDYERFYREVLMPLKTDTAFAYRPYDCRTGLLEEEVSVQPKRINIIEGSYSHHPYFGNIYDLRVFLEVNPEIRAQRIRCRLPMLQKKFFSDWIPMEQKYFETFSIREKADMVAVPKDNV